MNLFDVYPLYKVKPSSAKDVYVYDNQGGKYLDLYGGHAVISIGHSHPHYINQIKDQLDQIAFILMQFKIHSKKDWQMQ